MNLLSFVVDGLGSHYYRAELLLFSLEKFARFPKENIVVQCTTKVDAVFLNFLKTNHYNYTIIEPFLDEKYCNKIAQLDTFYQLENANVFLVDTDMFALSPLTIVNENKFCAKIVDAPNPPLSVLKTIFERAAIALADIVPTDFTLANTNTIDCNFNGGFYYLPNHTIKPIANSWKKWASWLFANPELFENNQQRIHTDQVAMALALAENKISYEAISSNNNCPIHYDIALRYFIDDAPITLLHYHNEINQFGRLKTDKVSNNKIKQAIQTANTAISQHGDFEFYPHYRKSLIKTITPSNNSDILRAALAQLSQQRRSPLKLILHAGTPKTATTSLQFLLANNQALLKQHCYLYPSNYSQQGEPKHQWLINALINNNVELLISQFSAIYAQSDASIHSIILSTEGIYNHWFDFSPEAKAYLSVINEYMQLKLWIFFREPIAFITSLYCQYLKNPRLKNIACYGQDLSFNDLLSDNWFIGHLDYIGFVYEIEALLNKDAIKIFRYQDNIIELFCAELAIALPVEIKRNVNLSSCSIELVRVINKLALTESDKANIVVYLNEMDTILTRYSAKFELDTVDKQGIIELTALGLTILNSQYLIDLR
jgi:hypothetical protein